MLGDAGIATGLLRLVATAAVGTRAVESTVTGRDKAGVLCESGGVWHAKDPPDPGRGRPSL